MRKAMSVPPLVDHPLGVGRTVPTTMNYCYICTHRGQFVPEVNRLASRCPLCGVVYTFEIYQYLQDLIQRGAPHGVVWDEIFSVPQPTYNGTAAHLRPDQQITSRERRDWDERESARRDRYNIRSAFVTPNDIYNQLVYDGERLVRDRYQDQINRAQGTTAYEQEMVYRRQQNMQQQMDMPYPTCSMTTFSPQQIVAREHTPEERENMRRRQEEANALYQKQEKESNTARSRARELLVGVIGEPAVEKLDAGGTYPVPSKLYKGTHYHLRLKRKPVRVVRHGKTIQEICIQPTDDQMPDYDMVLALKKLIEHDETILVGTGNIVNSGVMDTIARTLRLRP